MVVFLSAIFLGLFALPAYENFYESAIHHHSGQVDREVIEAGGSPVFYSLFSLVSKVSGIPARELTKTYPVKPLGILWVLFMVFLLFRKKVFSLASGLRFASFASIGAVLIMRYAWIDFRYFLPQLFFAYFDEKKNKEEVSLLEKKITLWTLSLVILLAISAFFLGKSLVERSLDWKVGERIEFSFLDEQLGLNSHYLKKEDINEALPEERFNLDKGFGWANSLAGSQFWILTPPGSYEVKICNSKDCVFRDYKINQVSSTALRVPLKFHKSEESVQGEFLDVKDGGWATRGKLFPNVESFSIERTR